MAATDVALFVGTHPIADDVKASAVWVLIIAFLMGGVAKVRQPDLAAIAIANFRVLRRPRPIIGLALGIAELILAMLLAFPLFHPARPLLPLVAAASVLWLFTFIILRSLLAGERFSCFCFGNADTGLSFATLIRTLLLALLATIITILPAAPLRLSDAALAAIPAAALIGSFVLAGSVRRLVERNRKPLQITKGGST